MTAMFGWCLDGRHRLAGINPEYNEGKCPGRTRSGLSCICACHQGGTNVADLGDGS